MPKDDSLPGRKKMRKGTHSCFECRRRKIRCIFPPDNSEVCSECFARGSRCIDQENANPEVIVDHRKNLRERVSRLEALIDNLLEDKVIKSESPSQSDSASPKPSVIYHKDQFPPTPLSSAASSGIYQDNQRVLPERGHHVPILSVFEDALNDAEDQVKARTTPQNKAFRSKPDVTLEQRYTITNSYQDNITSHGNLAYIDPQKDGVISQGGKPGALSPKMEQAKQALLAMLPSQDRLIAILNSNSEWWQTWRRKCSGTSGPEQTLSQFAAQALITSNICSIGTVVLAVGICLSQESDDVDKYIEAVDRWVLADDELGARLEGMELLILKSKWYADVGQPRKCWLSYRKALMYAQLMGLHRKRTTSQAHESIWWSIYHGDRFLSLLLGLPYGINDALCDLTVPAFGGDYMHPLSFITALSQLTGKVIDRNQGLAEQSFAWALQLDQELEDLWKRLDPAWLDFTDLLTDADSNAAELRERIMGQVVYHQIRVYLHLPFMLKSTTNSRFMYSRTACLSGSREVLRLYQVLRTGSPQPLYECKAVDFIGFTSAVLVQIGLFNFGSTSLQVDPREVEADVRLVEISIDIFRRASSEKGGKVALQSAEVLERMMAKLKGSDTKPCDDDSNEFVIPYFGTISIRKGGQTLRKDQVPRPPNQATSPPPARSVHSNSISSPQYTTTPKSATSPANPYTPPWTSLTPLPPSIDMTNKAPAVTNPQPFVSYDGFYNWNNLNADDSTHTGMNAHINDDSMNNFPLPTNNFSWQHMPMDIDQDWSWFLNDGQTQAQGVGAPVGTAPLDAFGAQGFTGFG
ncbi:hypothetical protein P153DRAFT_107119 [Dothidotthia symphoricarpi CBS 119687]|uniref:Zn(2)-C6 fungal-type domain-containing protein n=1 Tax=Dothidotthia symphoricarpi CBS 119687 TaxID=1392245 RepID=A0A6A6ARN2_9PLEO|nr:uncharacterized protein P153DRAFT_107119 [Dothidotthia symphoricarpi CBS 119687]KAF2134206.1 hypothetical protein P153DRAFT_107119 [Dothidotthia symphoricarpi CBS 119687]